LTQKKSYSRYFIILQEDEKGYALASDKLPSGYAKLEIKGDKCKISYYVQNLKKESAPYHMILVCNKKDMKKLIKVGELNIDDHGRAEICYEYGVDNVANCGINVDKVAGAAIVRFMNSNIIPVMSGFASTEIPEWKGFPIIEDELRRQESEVKDVQVETVKAEEKGEKKEEQRVEEEQRNIFEEYEKKIEEVKVKEDQDKEVIDINEVLETAKVVEDNPRSSEETEQTVVNQNETSFKEEVKQAYVEEEQVETEENHEELQDSRNKHKKLKNEVCEVKLEIECKQEKGEKCEGHHKHEEKHEYHCNDEHHKKHDEYLKDSVGSFFKELSEGFEEMTGVCGEIKRCKWYKVPVYRPEDMMHCPDYNKHTVVYYPMINYYPYIKRHGHFILGYKYDRYNSLKYLVYAVPGTKSRADQPFGGRSGFVTWVPLNVGDEREDSIGYWLMFYDFRSSTIVIPVK
jgi:hypothetical protein